MSQNMTRIIEEFLKRNYCETSRLPILSQGVTKIIEEHFKSLPDPRKQTANQRHQFIDILIIAICGIICGSDGWVAVEKFGKAKESWFRSFLELPNGIPSHDTFTDVFRKLSSKKFEVCFTSWTQSISELFDGEIVEPRWENMTTFSWL